MSFWSTLVAIADTFVPGLREGLLASIWQAQGQLQLDALALALRSGRVDNVLAVVLGGATADTTPAWDPLKAALQQTLQQATQEWDQQLSGTIGVSLHAGPEPYTLRRLERVALSQIREIDTTTRAGIRHWLQVQAGAGANPRTLITQLAGVAQPDGSRQGGILGLTQRQAQAVANYRGYLLAGDPRALQRALRDHRSDAAVRAAIAGGPPLTPDKVDALVRRYESRYLAYRAEVVARTESLRAMAQGQRAAWDQAIAQGRITADRLSKRWVTAHDERVRHEHVAMDGVTVPYNDLFTFDRDGKPGPADTGPIWGPPVAVQCRCVAWVRPRIQGKVAT